MGIHSWAFELVNEWTSNHKGKPMGFWPSVHPMGLSGVNFPIIQVSMTWENPKQMEVSEIGGSPTARWCLFPGKSQSKMDDDCIWLQLPLFQKTSKSWKTLEKIFCNSEISLPTFGDFLQYSKKKTVNMEDLMGRRKLYQIVLNGVYDGMQSEKSSNLGINHGREIPELGAMDRVE